MTTSIRLGRVAGIDLYLHPTFLLLLAFFGLSGGLESVVLLSAVFGCVLLHEFGHALTARGFGIETEDITLYPIGGVARLRRLPRAAGAELLITLAGPAVNVAIAAGLGALLWLSRDLGPSSLRAPESPVADFVMRLLVINLGLAIFNMIPAFPMDGGRILRALLSGWLGRLRATEIAAGLGRILAVVFGIYSLVQFTPDSLVRVFLAGFVYMAAGSELARVQAEEGARGRQSGGRSGVFEPTPPGYRWVDRGQGVWQLAPISVPTTGSVDPNPRPWL